FKRYQIQPVWRADRPARGRFREFYQCDIDTVGTTSVLVEVEQIAAVCEVLQRLGFSDFSLRLNDRRVLAAFLEHFGIPVVQHGTVLVAVDKLDKVGIDGVRDELLSRGVAPGPVEETIAFFRSLPQPGAGTSDDVVAMLGRVGGGVAAE